jgi:hypothetical protein
MHLFNFSSAPVDIMPDIMLYFWIIIECKCYTTKSYEKKHGSIAPGYASAPE